MIDITQGEGNKRERKRNKKPTKAQLAAEAANSQLQGPSHPQDSNRQQSAPNTSSSAGQKSAEDMDVDDDNYDEPEEQPAVNPAVYKPPQRQQLPPVPIPRLPRIDESNIDPSLRGHVVGTQRPRGRPIATSARHSPYPTSNHNGNGSPTSYYRHNDEGGMRLPVVAPLKMPQLPPGPVPMQSGMKLPSLPAGPPNHERSHYQLRPQDPPDQRPYPYMYSQGPVLDPQDARLPPIRTISPSPDSSRQAGHGGHHNGSPLAVPVQGKSAPSFSRPSSGRSQGSSSASVSASPPAPDKGKERAIERRRTTFGAPQKEGTELVRGPWGVLEERPSGQGGVSWLKKLGASTRMEVVEDNDDETDDNDDDEDDDVVEV